MLSLNCPLLTQAEQELTILGSLKSMLMTAGTYESRNLAYLQKLYRPLGASACSKSLIEKEIGL